MSDKFFGKGIPLASGFDLGAKAPLDARIMVQNIQERDAHVTKNRAFAGMLVFVIDEGKTYRYNGHEWEFIPSEADVQLMIADAQFTGGGNVDLSNFVTKEELSGLATKEDLNQFVTTDDLSQLATKDELNEKANLSDIPTKLSNLENDLSFTTNSDVQLMISDAIANLDEVDLSGLATKEELNEKANISDIPTKVSELSNDLSFATESFVQNKIAEAQLNQGGEVDLSGLATKDELNEKMDKFDLSIYATQEYVDDRIVNHDHNIASNEEVDSFVDDIFF